MRLQIAFKPLIHNRHWMIVRICSALMILASQANYSHAFAQTFSGSAPKIEATYDKGIDETVVVAETMLEERYIEVESGPPLPFPRNSESVKEFIRLLLGYTHKGRRIASPPDYVTIAFECQARKRGFGQQEELLSIIDGQRLGLGQMSHFIKQTQTVRELLQPYEIEYLRVEVPLNTFLQLARARTAILIIGSKELKLGEQNFNVLSAFANCLMGKAVPTINTLVADPKCPFKAPDLPALRGLKIGMSIQDVKNLYQGKPPDISKPDILGIRSMEVDMQRQGADKSTGLEKFKVRFSGERIFFIEAKYSVGEEWKNRRKDFADFISGELGAPVNWEESAVDTFTKSFSLYCEGASIFLKVNAADALLTVEYKLTR